MKILIKSLAGGNFHLDAEPTDTIATIKGKIKEAQGHAPEQQKIIFSGKILTDDKTVSDCNIKEKDFLVVMVSKPKAVKPAATAAAAATPAGSSSAAPAQEESAPAAPAAAAKAEDKPAATAETTAATSSTTEATPAAPAAAAADTAATQPAGTEGSSGSFLAGPQLESAMQNMVEMGFERDQVQRAMRAAFNNPDRAVEYLMTGIPASAEQPQPPPQQPSQPAAGAQAGSAPARSAAPAAATATTAPSAPSNPRAGNLFEAAAAQAQGGRGGGGGGAGGLGDLAGEDNEQGDQVIDLGNPAMLAQLQQLVQQNPAALQPLVQAIAQSNPQLAEALNQDPQGVLSLLAGGAGAGGEEMDLPTMEELSEEDRTAVQQIVAMGIPESKAIESFFMCGKNVEMAVQYYFENPQDFDD